MEVGDEFVVIVVLGRCGTRFGVQEGMHWPSEHTFVLTLFLFEGTELCVGPDPYTDGFFFFDGGPKLIREYSK